MRTEKAFLGFRKKREAKVVAKHLEKERLLRKRDTADRLVKVPLIPQLKHLARRPDLLPGKQMSRLPQPTELRCGLDQSSIEDLVIVPCIK